MLCSARLFGYTATPDIGPEPENTEKPRPQGEASNPAVYRRRRLLRKASKLWFRLTGERLVGINRARRNAQSGDYLALIRLFWSDIEDQLNTGLAGDTDVARRVLGLTR